ncbi:M20 family metallopeptidase [Pseudoroseomonas cervicalis]|uniref:M20 family metallopeptidase n=1 Tax=Teichococcus cervicalis TaxID=204525 RepID=UPI00277F9423|nr:M20 family metallopeptidase [Pseudoroseomonas cervicalis]MDQ1078449.1 aminobenzoyl-glutamate utilization protein B [Pseudoroseomonas cervicalis]
MQNTDSIWRHVEAKRPRFSELSDQVWATPELNYAEHRSAAAHAEALQAEGFRVTTGIAGIPTAVMGEAGEDGPVIAILGEYDALPGLSQEAGVAEHRPIEAGGHGHGCGHNLLGAASLLAATAVKDWLAEQGIKGRVRYYGCPAEEGGSAKGFMVRDGVFDDVDIAICWHPAAFSGVNKPRSLACMEVDFSFTGRSSHAAAAPHLGRSALDAVELMNVGVNYMREHMPSHARIHYALQDAGGIAPNVVQGKARVRYLVRSLTMAEVLALLERVKKIAEGAALMTETSVVHRVLSADAELVANPPLEQAMEENFLRLGPPEFDEADKEFARQIQATLTPAEIEAAYRRAGLDPVPGEVLAERLVPLSAPEPAGIGSTDVGTVSWAVPTVQARGVTYAIGTPGHSWQLVAQGKAPAAHKGLEHVAKVMAGTAVDVLTKPELLARARQDHAARTAGMPDVFPIPKDVPPPLDMAGHS